MVEKLERYAAWLVLTLLLVGANAIGNLSTYAYGALLLLSLPLLLSDARMRARLWRVESGAYAAAFLMLALAFTLSADQPGDIGYIANFIWFLMFIPAVALFSANAGPRSSVWFATLALAGSVVALLVALYEVKILGIDRVVGFVNLTNPFAMASVMLGFLALTGFFAPSGKWRYAFLLGPVLATGSAILAGTRGAIVMIAVLLLLAFLFWVISFRGRKRLYALLSGVVVAVCAIAGLVLLGEQVRAFTAFEAIGAYFGTGHAVDFSTEIRLNLYYGGIQAFLESPIFGHGRIDQFEAARPFMSQLVNDNTVGWSHLHNDYVNFAALAGVLGLAAYLIYMLTPVIGAVRSPRDSQYAPRLYGALVICLSYAVYGIFDTSFAMELLLGFGPVCTAALLGFCVDRPANGEARAIQ